MLVSFIAVSRVTMAGDKGRCRARPFLAWVAVMVKRALSRSRSSQVTGKSSDCNLQPHSMASWVTVRWGSGSWASKTSSSW